MPLKFININNSKIAYLEKNENAPFTIFFLHGNSSSHQTWQNIFEHEKLDHYRLIAFDLPAHGASDGISDYSLPTIGRIMAENIHRLSVDKPFIVVGVSLGTNIIAETIAYDINPLGIVLAGPCIIGEDCGIPNIMIPETSIGLSFVDKLSSGQLNELDKLFRNHFYEKYHSRFADDFNSVKDDFRSKFGKSVAEGKFSDQIQIINKKNPPTLVIFGDADQVFYPDYLDNITLPLWNNKVYKIPGGHWIHLDNPDVFNDLLSSFAMDIFK